MAPMIAYTLPAMQLICNLVMPEAPGLNDSNIGLIVNQPPPQIQSATLPDGYVLHPGIGVAYKLYPEKQSWKSAREKCIQEGAHLPVIDSYIKLEYLLNQIQPVDIIHVGIHSLYDDAKWVSASTGLTISDVPWAHGEPNGGHDCVMAYRNPRGLRNYACTEQANIACELPIPMADVPVN